MRAFLGMKGFERIDAAYLTRNLNRKFGRVEGGDPAYAASHITESIPQFIARVTQWSKTAKATDYNPVRAPVSATDKGHPKIIHLNPKVGTSSCR